MPNDNRLTRVHVDLPNHPSTGGEGMWALALGDELYELRNVPLQAYDLNLGDVVLATRDSPELVPEIREVVRRSGHRTMRVVFKPSVPEARKLDLVQSLRFLSASFERGTERCFALDLPPEADITRVQAILDEWQDKGWGEYETCESRVPGSFDDAPEELT